MSNNHGGRPSAFHRASFNRCMADAFPNLSYSTSIAILFLVIADLAKCISCEHDNAMCRYAWYARQIECNAKYNEQSKFNAIVIIAYAMRYVTRTIHI